MKGRVENDLGVMNREDGGLSDFRKPASLLSGSGDVIHASVN